MFHVEVTVGLVRDFLDGAGSKTLIIKTHSELHPEVRKLIDAGQVHAFTSFRDPRDTCRAMLDAGISDRAKGDMRYFAKFHAVEDWIKPLARQMNFLQTWTQCNKVLSIPYYLTANKQDFVVQRLCAHLGHGETGGTLAAEMQSKKETIPEFNKGISDRFLTDFSNREIAFLNTALQKQISIYQKLAKANMAKLGHRMLHDHLVAIRKGALESRGLTEVF